MTTPTYPGYQTLDVTELVAVGDFYSMIADPCELHESPETMCVAGRDTCVKAGLAVGWARAKARGPVWVFRKLP